MADAPLTPEVRELLAALRDILDVPSAADYADRHAEQTLTRSRLLTARFVLDHLLEDGHTTSDPVTLATTVARNRLASLPLTYAPRAAR